MTRMLCTKRSIFESISFALFRGALIFYIATASAENTAFENFPDELDIPSFVTLRGSFDDASGRGYSLDIETSIPGARLILGLSKSENTDRPAYDIDSWLLGAGSDPLLEWEIGFEFEHWGEDDAFTIDNISVRLNHHTRDWSFELKPTRREITISGINRDADSIKINFESNGLNLTANYYGFRKIALGLGYASFDYSRDVRQLDPFNNPILFRILSPTALGLAQGLDDYFIRLSIDWSLGDVRFGYELQQAKSAVSQLKANTSTLSLALPISSKWDLLLESGRQDQDGNDAINFAVLGLLYSW